MHYTKYKINEYLIRSKALLNNSMNDSNVLGAVEQYGYDERKLEEGRRCYLTLNEIEEAHQAKKNERVACFSRKQTAYKSLQKSYMKYLKIARIAFDKDLDARNSLLLDGPRERNANQWMYQVSLFCSNLINHKEFLIALNQFGVDLQQIVGLRNELDQYVELSEKCVKVTGELRQLTMRKKQQTLVLQHWLSDYIKIARIALESTPHTLEKLGIVGKS
jgi:hypothetical protein